MRENDWKNMLQMYSEYFLKNTGTPKSGVLFTYIYRPRNSC